MTQMPKFDINQLLDIVSNYCSKLVNNCSKSILLQKVDHQLIDSMQIWRRSLFRHSTLMIREMNLALNDFLIADHLNLQLFDILYWYKVNEAVRKIAHHACCISSIALNSKKTYLKTPASDKLFAYSEDLSIRFVSAIRAFTTRDSRLAMKIKSEKTKLSYPINARGKFKDFNNSNLQEAAILLSLKDIEYSIGLIIDAALDLINTKLP
ncbi:MAG: hypothetical protein ACXAC2_12270 [Candidatus Kariarchaeaceae archaeon]|jgi:hypothetical protein